MPIPTKLGRRCKLDSCADARRRAQQKPHSNSAGPTRLALPTRGVRWGPAQVPDPGSRILRTLFHAIDMEVVRQTTVRRKRGQPVRCGWLHVACWLDRSSWRVLFFSGRHRPSHSPRTRHLHGKAVSRERFLCWGCHWLRKEGWGDRTTADRVRRRRSKHWMQVAQEGESCSPMSVELEDDCHCDQFLVKKTRQKERGIRQGKKSFQSISGQLAGTSSSSYLRFIDPVGRKGGEGAV